MSKPSLLLVHSPLVGRSSWRPMAEQARGRGFDVLRPDLTGVGEAPPPQWKYFADVAGQSAVGYSDLVVVGHSGAGAVLPATAERIGDRLRALIFVDAVVPPPEGEHMTSAPLLDFLESKAVGGVLPPWLDWWPSGVVDELVPDPREQAELRADMPELSMAFYAEAVPVPSGWSAWPCAYLKLSAAYDQEYATAAAMGWACAAIDGTHLSTFTNPATVLHAIEDLVVQVDHD